MNKRDDFPVKVKTLLARRVGFRCSNPNCRQPTSGPSLTADAATNIGVAAHITAAAADGPRYDPPLSKEERIGPANGIWLCQNHAKLIDCDDARYSVEHLQEWKRLAEAAAALELEAPHARRGTRSADVERLLFFSQCLDRPAFQDRFQQERSSTRDFDRAIEDTITAFNTGCLRARDGGVLHRGEGKSFLENRSWRSTMDTITDQLRAIRSRYDTGKRLGQINVHRLPDGSEHHHANDPELADWIDSTRANILELFSGLCREADIPELHFVSSRHRW